MYKYLLCWRYLRTRYIALASVISVMLGVATMIVVNAVMAGFSDKMRDRLHGVLADLVVESASMDGFDNFEEVMARVQEAGGDDVLAMAPTMETPGILKYRVGSGSMTRPVQIIGVRAAERARTGDFAEFLFDEKGEKVEPSFQVPERLKEISPAGARLKELEGEPEDAFKRPCRSSSRSRGASRFPIRARSSAMRWGHGTRGRVSLTSTSRTSAPRSAWLSPSPARSQRRVSTNSRSWVFSRAE